MAAAAPILPAAADEADEATEDALEVAELKSPPPELNCDDSEDWSTENSEDNELLKPDATVDPPALNELNCELRDSRREDAAAEADDNAAEAEVPVMIAPLPMLVMALETLDT